MYKKSFNIKLVLLFYLIILVTTYLFRQCPNVLQIILLRLTGLNFPFNYNHGIAIFITTYFFYKFGPIKQEISLLGSKKYLSFIFPIILLTGYSIKGFENDYNININLWAFLFCLSTLIYDLMEEYAWRGFLIDSLGSINFWIKSIISGVLWACWHFLIFENFNQFGGFSIFLLFSIIFSIILTYSRIKTNSIIIPATLHATLVRTNYLTLIIFFMYFILLFFWNNNRSKRSIRV